MRPTATDTQVSALSLDPNLISAFTAQAVSDANIRNIQTQQAATARSLSLTLTASGNELTAQVIRLTSAADANQKTAAASSQTAEAQKVIATQTAQAINSTLIAAGNDATAQVIRQTATSGAQTETAQAVRTATAEAATRNAQSLSLTQTMSGILSQTPIPTVTPIPTSTISNIVAPLPPSNTPTFTPSFTPTFTWTPSLTPVPVTTTPPPSPTHTPTRTPTFTWMPTFTPTPTNTPTPTLFAQLQSPSNGATIDYGATLTVSWFRNGGDFYAEHWGQVSGTSNWSPNTSWFLGVPAPGTYYWHVKARKNSVESAWSDTWTFTVSVPIQTVTAYRDENYQGWSVSWTGPGYYKPPDDFQMSSIQIPPGYSVRLYEHSTWTTDYGGGHTCLDSSLADFTTRLFDNQHQLNDRVTSLIIYDHPGC